MASLNSNVVFSANSVKGHMTMIPTKETNTSKKLRNLENLYKGEGVYINPLCEFDFSNINEVKM